VSDHLLLRPSGYYFRIGIPADVRPVFRRRELKFLLPPTDRKTAVLLSSYCALRVTAMIKSYRERAMNFGRNDRVIISNFESKTDSGMVKIDKIEVDGEGDIEKEIAALKETLNSLLQGGSLFSVHPSVPQIPASLPALRMSDLIKKFTGEKESTHAWTEKTMQEFSASYEILQLFLGDAEVTSITRDQAVDFLNTLQKLPPNMNKNPLYRGKSLDIIVKMPHKSTLSAQTINKHMVRASMLFGWGLAQKYATDNPFGSLAVKNDKRPNEQRSAFKDEHLGILFGHGIFTERKYLHPYMYWVPLLGLYTGMRLEEICQLHVEDVKIEDEIWVIDVNDNDGKKLKTDSSRRVVPIHSELIRLGFVGYCKSQKNANQKILFSELKKGRDGYSQSVSKWFGRYRESRGISGRGLDFHSFRHTVADRLKKDGVEEKLASTILGHEAHGITYGRYAKGYLKETLQCVIERLSYSTLGI
jgi:integrase